MVATPMPLPQLPPSHTPTRPRLPPEDAVSISGMMRDYVRKQEWRELQKSYKRRKPIRDAARAVLEASTDEEEFAAIVKLSKVLP